MREIDLDQFVADFASAFKAADALRPQAVGLKSGIYQPGIGPHGEDAAVRLVLAQFPVLAPNRYLIATQVPYPGDSQRCDLGLGSPLDWAIEVKMARAFGDNGKPDDTYLKVLLSPYAQDHSALSDAAKLRSSKLACRKSILVYGFDYPRRPLEPALLSLEALLRSAGPISQRFTATFDDLVHPVHGRGCVVAWEVRSVVEMPSGNSGQRPNEPSED